MLETWKVKLDVIAAPIIGSSNQTNLVNNLVENLLEVC